MNGPADGPPGRPASGAAGQPRGRPTMEDVAERADVSRALVSLVINGSPKVSEQKRRRVLEAARALGYRPNLMARSLAQQRTRIIGVLVNDLRNPFFAEVVEGVETAAESDEFGIVVLNGRRDRSRELAAVETLVQLQVEGLALVGTQLDRDDLAEVADIVPTVMVASDLVGSLDHPGVDAIVTDGRRGAELVVEHLVALGHERILHVDGADNASAAERRQGYLRGMEAAGLGGLADVRTGGDDEAAAFAVIDEVLAEPDAPTAIFAFNDLLAAGVLDRLDDAEVSVPAEVSLVGFDNTFIAALHHLALTTVNQPRLTMGEMAVAALLERLNHGRDQPVRHTLEPELVVRGTTGPPPPGAVGHGRSLAGIRSPVRPRF